MCFFANTLLIMRYKGTRHVSIINNTFYFNINSIAFREICENNTDNRKYDAPTKDSFRDNTTSYFEVHCKITND